MIGPARVQLYLGDLGVQDAEVFGSVGSDFVVGKLKVTCPALNEADVTCFLAKGALADARQALVDKFVCLRDRGELVREDWL